MQNLIGDDIARIEYNYKRKISSCPEIFLILAFISRILYQTPLLMFGDNHLSRRYVAIPLKRHSVLSHGTALHPGKDLAVSPPVLPQKLTRKGCSSLSLRASLLAPLRLLSTGITRYPSPGQIRPESVRTFLSCFHKSDYPTQASTLNHKLTSHVNISNISQIM